MPPLTYIHASEAARTTAGGSVETMLGRDIVNIVKREQIMPEFLGHSKDLAQGDSVPVC